ncbi:hypothetical protein TGME49_223040 [Toxoplasma gondii ME49]|uniref:Uncharacterized protein n=2 Tax=Toxoplasma gondii TaxID=5811 RepID=S8FBB2_TOXGM|nr:hypothetical protein TGME49_223040 [Toxoplasma gondii ME49]6TMG_H Chain H, ATPTG6 [Toxoplasma gondii GT1]6TMG_h Chain h, ATPTG6 [Toxoplasma gondii GT1]6TMK_H Chain H, ATPTG6 [Toxoplasma gondii GT1]6TMK_h Chain h, ATPTG6 [Toxoplasma gondii GT1]6TML_H7 Chain H7, ATPTG6 [Toxoplasma gondii GT1]6TML_H8 Chain H8, ATPTG6 [Toxoplasma gondii GT1]6TML_H9 Chain H9, ATPTG6 [Toxoplasma gondii GT1]6TML_h7 Chain h7, ATPTG6 [Toxoplasma gondii GT1]6TML_h8 Chain h8, ATPTG6 [Toxoplasma gondii GT1]6TML_h9|eukprot:XP_002370091.1 hypothetical protein TGME49_223040 [Toxoplasma gondii ME49]
MAETREGGQSGAASILGAEAFPELLSKVPLNPQMDEDKHFNKYKWGNEPIPVNRRTGSRMNSSIYDNRNHEAVRHPWSTDARTFHPNDNPEADRINTQYSNMVSDSFPEGGFSDAPRFSSNWERLLAYHHGLYSPEKFNSTTKTADEIRLAVNDFAAKVHADDPKNACKYLMIEEFKCLQSAQARIDPQGAATKCVKWFNEWRQCAWDQEKMVKGYNYIEDRRARKHKPYIGAPDLQYS